MARRRGRRNRGRRGGRDVRGNVAGQMLLQQINQIPGDMSGWTSSPIPGAGFSLGGFFKGITKIGKIIPGVGNIIGIGENILDFGKGIITGQPAPQPIVGFPPQTDFPACPDGTFWDAQLEACLASTSPIGRERGAGSGQMVEGRYGPAEVPSTETRQTSVCDDGMVLGDDDLCYKHIDNSDRKYPRGRAPLLTGGERNAITTAAGAARKMTTAKKSLERLGLLKRPTRRAAPRHSIKHP